MIDCDHLGIDSIEEAENGLDALEKISQGNFHLLLSDIRMPGMDGLELSRLVQEKHPNMKVVILSGHHEFEYAQKVLRYQVRDYLLKPVQAHTLNQTLEKVISELKEGKERDLHIYRMILRQLLEGSLIRDTDPLGLFVFYWMFSVSVKSDVDSASYPPVFFHFTPTFHAYKKILTQTPFVKYIANTLIVSIGTVLAGLLIGLPAAYGIVRWRMQTLSVAIVATRMIPSLSFLVPWFLMFRTLHLNDTFVGLILAQLTINLPMVIWLMIGFFLEIPKELHDAARIDGCNEFREC
jgi:ABC-type maltose transport system permease subunit